MEERKTRKHRLIDFSKKRTEYEWGVIVENFYSAAAPIWFKWVGWLLATGAISYLVQKTNSQALIVVESISYVLMSMYFMFFLLSIKIEPIFTWKNKLKSKVEKWTFRFIEFSILGGLIYGTEKIISEVVELVIKFK